MNHNQYRALQDEILDGAVHILRSDPRVLGMVLIGSRASGMQDAFSDIDLLCFFRDEERSGRPTLYQNIADLSPTLWYAWLYDLNALYLYENGVRLDIDFCKPSQLDILSRIPAKKIVVYDPDQVFDSLDLSDDLQPPAKHPAVFQPGDQVMVDWFFWMFRQIVCWSKRSAQGTGKAYEKLANAIDSLAQVRTRLIEMRLWVLGVNEYLQRVDLACAQRMALTYPHFDAEEVIDCTYRLLDEYERITPAYCEKSGAVYPGEKVKLIRSLIDDFSQLS